MTGHRGRFGWVVGGVLALAAATAGAEPPKRIDPFGDPLPAGAVARVGTARLRHGKTAGPLLFTADGRGLVSCGTDPTVRLWEVPSGRELRRFTGMASPPSMVAVSADGRFVAASDQAAALLWDAAGRLRHRWSWGDSKVLALGFSGDGQVLAVAVGDGAIRLFETASGHEARRLDNPRNEAECLAFSSGGRLLAAGGDQGTVRVWDTATGKKQRTYEGGKAPAAAGVAFAPDGKTVAACADGKVLLWSADSEDPAPGFTPPEAELVALRYAADGKGLEGVHPNGTVTRWDLTGREQSHVGQPREGVQHLTVSPDGRTMAGTEEDGGIVLWDAATGRALASAGQQVAVSAVALTDAGRQVLVAAEDGTVRRSDAATGRELGRAEGFQKDARPAALTADGRVLAQSGGEDGPIRLSDPATGRELRTLPGHPAGTISLRFTPDGRWLASLGNDRVLAVWDVAAGRAVRRFAVSEDDDLKLVAVAGDGRTVAWVGGDGTARLGEVATAQVRSRFPVRKTPTALALSPDGRLLAVGDKGGDLCLYRCADGRVVRHLTEHADAVSVLLFTPDGRRLASGSADRTVRLWDVATGEELARLEGHDADVSALAFSPDGRRLASGGDDTTVIVWDVARPDRPETAPAAGLESCWDELASEDAAKAHAAQARLAEKPKEAVELLTARLHPAVSADPKLLARLLADLDSPRYPARQQALAELERLGDRSEPALRQALARASSAEARQHLEGLLQKLDGPVRDPDTLRSLRAVEVLEWVGTPEAKALLERLAGGAAEARATREAKAALERQGRGRP